MRSWIWFVVVGVIAIAAVAVAERYLEPRVAAAEADMLRVVVPGTATLKLDNPGGYVIFHETKSTVDGRYYASDRIEGLQLRLTSDATGAEVKLDKPGTSTSYEFDDRSGRSIYAFSIAEPGRYRLVASLAGGRDEPKAVLAISRGGIGAMFSAILGAFAIGFGGVGIAAVLLFVVLWRRSKAAKAGNSRME